MKAKVKLTHSVEIFVEGESEDEIMDWLRQTTPRQVVELISDQSLDESYDEEIICFVDDNSIVDYTIK